MRQPALAARVRRRLRRVPLAHTLRDAAMTGIDGLEGVLRGRDPLRPPRRLRGVGAGDFRDVGEAIVSQLVELGGLRAGDRVLDIGCGSGRVALPLMNHLGDGAYEGFDIDGAMISWCRRTIADADPRFGFTLVDVSNTHYNPAGDLAASALRFPYRADAFDFALATSLFTHLLPSGFANYAAEAARVLAPGGTLFATFLLTDDDALARVARGEAQVDLRHRLSDPATGEPFLALDPDTPETAVGLDSGYVRETFARAGLTVSAVHPGTWAGRAQGASYQDIVIARREPPARSLSLSPAAA